ncbi:X-ray repair cross-complementing protein 5 [Dinochytrium kinnereticum]|nr:X-ray repair cross-complementing protein 5 [Dinochytrium kinnereticum]
MSFAKLTTSLVTSVGTADPVADFRAMLSRRDVDLVSTAVQQMTEVILNVIQKSFGTQLFSKALQCITALREGCIIQSEVSTYNTWLQQFKSELVQNHTQFWETLKEAENKKLGLIRASESGESAVTDEEAVEFFAEGVKVEEVEPDSMADVDEDEMLGMLD